MRNICRLLEDRLHLVRTFREVVSEIRRILSVLEFSLDQCVRLESDGNHSPDTSFVRKVLRLSL
jgi:hypothetical protein